MRVAYIVPFLEDEAVRRRIVMLQRGGAHVDLYGFYRVPHAPAHVEGVVPHILGRMEDGKLGRRIVSVLSQSIARWSVDLARADVILARNLECLFLGATARLRMGRRCPLVYELLDVHSAMLGDNPGSAALRGLERRLLRQSDAVIVSSPAFESDYLARRHANPPDTLLIENKVLGDVSPVSRGTLPDAPPWRIGWFGGIRCRRSLACLSELAKQNPGLFELHIRGRFANTDLGDLERILRETPGLHFHGPYRYPDDLGEIYGQVHFAWAIDFYEDGGNSGWLLPNRLYESLLCGAVPIAMRGVETGRWLARHGVGLLVDQPFEQGVRRLLASLTAEQYRGAQRTVDALEPSLVRCGAGECRALVQRLEELARRRARTARQTVHEAAAVNEAAGD